MSAPNPVADWLFEKALGYGQRVELIEQRLQQLSELVKSLANATAAKIGQHDRHFKDITDAINDIVSGKVAIRPQVAGTSLAPDTLTQTSISERRENDRVAGRSPASESNTQNVDSASKHRSNSNCGPTHGVTRFCAEDVYPSRSESVSRLMTRMMHRNRQMQALQDCTEEE